MSRLSLGLVASEWQLIRLLEGLGIEQTSWRIAMRLYSLTAPCDSGRMVGKPEIIDGPRGQVLVSSIKGEVKKKHFWRVGRPLNLVFLEVEF
jgi:hypothetical protein